MTDDIADLFVDVHLSKVKLTSFLDGNCFVIASTVSEYSLWQMLVRVLADGNPSSQHNALNNHEISRFDIVFNGM